MRQIPEALDIRLAALARVALMGTWARRRDRVEDVGQQRVGAEAFGQHREPIAPDTRAIVAGEADNHERVVAKAELPVHENRMGTSAPASSGKPTWASKLHARATKT